MKAIILAAGKSKRLMPLTADKAKSMVEIKGKPLIHYTLENLSALGITKVVIVVGHFADKYMSELEDKFENCDITYVVNEHYEKNDNMTSFWLAKDHIGEGVIMINADVIANRNIMKKLIEDTHPNASVVHYEEGLPASSMKVRIEDGKIIEFARDMQDSDSRAIGIHKFSPEGAKNYFAEMEKLIEDKPTMHQIETPLMEFLKYNELYAVSTEDYAWEEIDDANDLKSAENLIEQICLV